MRVPKLKADITLHDTADGNKWLSFGDIRSFSILKLHWFLQIGEGFSRDGHKVFAVDEWITLDFVRGSLRLKAGGDHWFGPHLMAVDEEGSDYLVWLHRELTHNQRLRSDDE